MHNDFAIRLQNVSKVYKLYGSQRDQLIDILGLHRLGIKPKSVAKEFVALDNINLNVPRGHRIGIIGRNGAGKTTLLKLLCGNFACSSGSVDINGEVQALMNVGLGFHPEYTGRQNVEASLQYSGLSRNDYRQAMEGVIEFCELGDFLEQPFKTYSLGMQARLMFAAATAIHPDILIIDEVLGAGDAYFITKSKQRVETLINSGCTMILVSHSMQQVLELCNDVVWLEGGRIRMMGEAFSVVKAYEESLHNPKQDFPIHDPKTNGSIQIEAYESPSSTKGGMQEPTFHPHGTSSRIEDVEPAKEFSCLAPGGISSWGGIDGLRFSGFTILTESGASRNLISLHQAKFVISIEGEISGDYDCRYGLSISDYSGKCITSIFSPRDRFSIEKGGLRRICLFLNPCQLGSGGYVIGMSILGWTDIAMINSAPRYDLLSRSFSIEVEVPNSLAPTDGVFYHSGEWSFG